MTSAYSVEHEDEARLLEELSALLAAAPGSAAAPPPPRPRGAAAVAALARKVEEVHTTLRAHLAKEEAQLLPLLLARFTRREQAALVAQFLGCVPLAAVRPVLAWLRRAAPAEEQAALRDAVADAVPEPLLRELLCGWLEPTEGGGEGGADEPGTPDQAGGGEFVCCGGGARSDDDAPAGRCAADVEDCGGEGASVGGGGGGGPPPLSRPPLREILHLHAAIRSALSAFADEARALRAAAAGAPGGAPAPAQLAALVERHRFLRAVCLSHAASEDEVVFPALRRLAARRAAATAAAAGGPGPAAGAPTPAAAPPRHRCEDDHAAEGAEFERLGRLLGDVRACARRGAGEVSVLADDLAATAGRLARSMGRHMAREEAEVLPVLEGALCAAEQRHMVWATLRGMPLRLLERVMPWVAGGLAPAEVEAWLGDVRRAAPAGEAPLVQLLSRWAASGGGGPGAPGAPAAPAPAPAAPPAASAPSAAAAAAAAQAPPPRKRARGGPAPDAPPLAPPPPITTALPPLAPVPPSAHPIDHIFQFHKALRRELADLEAGTVALAAAADAAPGWTPAAGPPLAAAVAALRARFTFLRGIYRAHSHAEDEIVFPALEAKEALLNVSHAYTLDHQREEELLTGVGAALESGAAGAAAAGDLPGLRAAAARLARLCAALRASLETHVRAEETELWPLFAEHFPAAEQERLVGLIIGRTGAEVLQAMLSWVHGALTPGERRAMMESLRGASRSTAFGEWLGAALGADEGGEGGECGGGAGAGGNAANTNAPPAAPPTREEEQRAVLEEVAAYLASRGLASGGGPDPAPPTADASLFRPGWAEIFRMNQKQLEAAVRRVSADAALEPARKAYLIQHLMASRYIVAQQRRMAGGGGGGEGEGTPRAGDAPAGAGAGAAGGEAEAAAAPADAAGAAAAPPAEAAAPCPPWRSYHDAAAGVLGCRHYRRAATLVAPCCGALAACRLCHDEADASHRLDRRRVAEMACMHCGTRQPVAQDCANPACGARLARHYCAICHLFDDDPSHEIYHCPFCNVCRRGAGLGVDAVHCMGCNACMAPELHARHRCTERALGGDCPVCAAPLFDSAAPVREARCGHFMHSACFAAYTRVAYACPLCSRSLGDMSVYWKMVDALLAAEQEALPPEYAARRQDVSCHDCGGETDAPFHFVYHKCGGCGGYNTRVK